MSIEKQSNFLIHNDQNLASFLGTLNNYSRLKVEQISCMCVVNHRANRDENSQSAW